MSSMLAAGFMLVSACFVNDILLTSVASIGMSSIRRIVAWRRHRQTDKQTEDRTVLDRTSILDERGKER